MTDQAVAATLEEGASQVVDGGQSTEERGALTPRHDARESALEAIAAARRAGTVVGESAQQEEAAAAAVVETPAQDGGETASGAQPAASDPNAELAAQIARQLADGKLVLTDDLLAKTVVKTKIDGVEEETPATKVVVQYQKNGAADVRLAEATRATREAQDLLKKAQETVASATTSAAPAKAEPKQEEVDAEIARLTKEHATALYNGDDEKAAQLLGQLVDARVQSALKDRTASGDPTPPVSVNDVVQQALPALKQQLSVESALTQLQKDYPELYADQDMALLADIRREELERAGKSRAEAIAEAGEIIGQKFGLGKYKKTDVQAAAATTRDLKLAAKAGLDEPTSAATRAPSTVQAPQTRSSVIAEMAAARGQARSP